MRAVHDVIQSLPRPDLQKEMAPLPAPLYAGRPDQSGNHIGLAVESMRRHMTDEGWQLFNGLQYGGYVLAGKDLYIGETDVPAILGMVGTLSGGERMGTLLLQDKREWEGLTADRNRDPTMCFRNVGYLSARPDIFKGTVLKDAQSAPLYHCESAKEIAAHFWVIYYAPEVVCHLAPYVRREHCVRTYHTVNADLVPKFRAEHRQGAVLSGALSGAYPLRQRLAREARAFGEMLTVRPHPGYHRNGCETPAFLQELSKYRVAICTSSVYGYALRKIIEATACGCRVITDLPCDDPLPLIDGNLSRVWPGIETAEMVKLVRRLCSDYEPSRQEHYARAAQCYYDYRVRGKALAADIESLRRSYGQSS